MSSRNECKQGVVVLGHGSRRAEGLIVITETAARFQERFPMYEVTHAFMELATPKLRDAIEYLVEKNVGKIIVVPLFLSFGHHMAQDLPQEMAELAARHPDVLFETKAPIGAHPVLCDIIYERLCE